MYVVCVLCVECEVGVSECVCVCCVLKVCAVSRAPVRLLV